MESSQLDSDAPGERTRLVGTGARAALLDRLRERRGCPAADQSRPQLLRCGDSAKPPIVLIPAAHAQLLAYRDLVDRLQTDRAVYGLGPDQLLTRAQPPSLRELAKHYCERLDRADIRPGVLAGWSFGGVVAFEMAQQLGVAWGEPPPVAVLDAMPCPAEYRGQERTDADVLRLYVSSVSHSHGHPFDPHDMPDEVWTETPAVALTALTADLAAKGVALDRNVDELATQLLPFRNSVLSLDSYEPAGSDVRIVLVRALEWEGPDPYTAWVDVVGADRVTVVDVATEHYGLLKPPHVDLATAAVCAALASGEDPPLQRRTMEGDPVPLVPDVAFALVERKRRRDAAAGMLWSAPLASEVAGDATALDPLATALRELDGEHACSFGNLAVGAATVAAQIADAGLAGSPVAVMIDGPFALAALLGALAVGAPCVTVGPDWSAEHIRSTLTATNARLLLTATIPLSGEPDLPSGCTPLRAVAGDSGAGPYDELAPPDREAVALLTVDPVDGQVRQVTQAALAESIASIVRHRRGRLRSALHLTSIEPEAMAEMFATWALGGAVTLTGHDDPPPATAALSEARTSSPAVTGDQLDSQDDHAADPQDAGTLTALASLWREIVGGQPSADDHFFELGGTSLGVAMLAMRIHEVFSLVVPIIDLFEHLVLSAQARLIDDLFVLEVERLTGAIDPVDGTTTA